MQSIKAFAPAALIALIAMALVGAGSAMAESTSLCKADETPCVSGNRVSHVHETTVTKAVLLGAVEVKCDVLFLGDVKTANNLGSPLQILGKFTYTNCKRENEKSCVVEEVEAEVGGSIRSFLKLGSELADVTLASEVHYDCGLILNCWYLGFGLIGHGLGPLTSTSLNGEVRFEEQEVLRIKGVCAETAILDLLTTPLEKTYISG